MDRNGRAASTSPYIIGDAEADVDTEYTHHGSGSGRLRDKRELGQASMTSSVANLCNTIIGTGMLATPGAFRYTGLLPGMFLIVLCGCTSAAGLLLLTLCADTLGGRSNSFFSVAMHTIPRGARLFDGAIAVKVRGARAKERRGNCRAQITQGLFADLPRNHAPVFPAQCFGVSISYLIICGQLMPQVVLSFAKALEKHEQLPDLLIDRSFWIFAFMLLLCPLCFQRRLDSLRHTSYMR